MLDNREQGLATAVLLERVISSAYTDKKSSSMQPLQWAILRYLKLASKEKCNVTSIGAFLELTHAPVSRAVSTLMKRGKLTNSTNPLDKRSGVLELTPEGLDTLTEDPMYLVAERIGALSDSDRMQFLRSIRTIAMQVTGKVN